MNNLFSDTIFMDTDFEGSDLRPFFFDFTWDQCGKVTLIAVFTAAAQDVACKNVVKTLHFVL